MLTTVLKSVDLYLKNNRGPYFAAFDADGTLWSNDVGENFFHYQIKKCGLPALRIKDPWKHYQELKKQHPPTAYLWLAQICEGYTLNEVLAWGKNTFEENPPQMFEFQRKLISELNDRQIKIFVVSASVEWAVKSALIHLGLNGLQAVGVKTKIVENKITTEQDGPVTWREGKRDALNLITNNWAPLLSCGNTLGDQHLLELSADVRLAVQSQDESSSHKDLYADEQGLLSLAKERNWLHFDLSKK
jgi:phosphoserine phosphatase